MAVTSPTSASPGLSLLDWDEGAVHSWLSHIGLTQYEEVVYDQGITGEVLAVVDHAALQDLGMASVGHRLNVLRGVWGLKKEQGLEVGEDEWKPQDGLASGPTAPVQAGQIDRLWDMIVEQQEKLVHLERQCLRLTSTLEKNGMALVPSSSGDGDVQVHGIPGMPTTINEEGWREFRDSDYSTTSTKLEGRASHLFPSSLASSTASQVPPPLSADSAHFQDSFTPTTATTTYPFDSPSAVERPNPSNLALSKQPPPMNRTASASSITTSSTSTKPSSKTSPPEVAGPSDAAITRAKDAARSAAKSFRVTLEDPCYKVLPAALKKYKINDDWKVYALFICYGNTERCLAYDEKPLMLFQKLKESGNRPVFMLRHIRDIKSPIILAQQKQAVKLGLPQNSTQDVLPKIKPAFDQSSSPTKGSLQPSKRGDEGVTPNGSGFPELPSPGFKEGESGPNSGKAVAGSGVLVDEEGNVQHVTYAVAIYPYIADRQDEFDVAVGSTFVILTKAKGWYIVQKDPDGLGNIVPDQAKSGWVPAGCLLEISSPISTVSPAIGDTIPTYPGLCSVIPSAVMSSSYPALILMDYTAKDSNEMSLKEGEIVKVYKKYCHWSYTINNEGTRGWVPSWYIGKMAHVPGEGEGEGAADTSVNDKALTVSRGSGGAGNGDEADDIIDGYKI